MKKVLTGPMVERIAPPAKGHVEVGDAIVDGTVAASNCQTAMKDINEGAGPANFRKSL